MANKWKDEDVSALRWAIEAGVISLEAADDSPEAADDEPFTPFAFPAELRYWGATRTGDIEVKLIVPNKWRSSISDMQLALRKRLVIHIQEWEPQEIIDVVGSE
jgi:hypothetical protein